MRSHAGTLGVRISFELRALVEQGGEKSAATRALLIIGSAACGLDLVAVREEIPDLVSKRLRPEVRVQLLELIQGGNERRHEALMVEPLHDDVFVDDEVFLGDVDGAGFDV